MSDRTEAEIRNAALEEAAQVCDKSSLQPAIAARIRALKSAPAAEESAKGADVAQPKRRPYNASASLSEYGVFPECDAAPVGEVSSEGAGGDWSIDHSAGRPILVYQNCSVIEAEQAEYVLRLIEADRQQRGGDVIDDMRAAVRFAPSSAYWSERLREFFGPDAREGINALEKQLREARAALSATKAGSTEKLLRFCPSCGRLGDLPAGSSYLACCPDHGDARMVPEKFARQCKQLFSDALAASKGGSNE